MLGWRLDLLDVVEQGQDLLPFHRRLPALRRLTLDEYVLDSFYLQLSFLFVVSMPQLQSLLGHLTVWILKLIDVSRHDVFWVNCQQLADR